MLPVQASVWVRNTLHLVVRLTVQGEAGSTMESQGTVCALRGTCDSPGACGLLNLGNTSPGRIDEMSVWCFRIQLPCGCMPGCHEDLLGHCQQHCCSDLHGFAAE